MHRFGLIDQLPPQGGVLDFACTKVSNFYFSGKKFAGFPVALAQLRQ
jgi:hypothetical protein